MAALIKTVGVFPKERSIVDRERAKGSYSLGPYLFSKLLAEIPIGAAFPLMFGVVLYPMARLHPTLQRFGKFCGIVTVESFAASAMGLIVGAMVPTTEAAARSSLHILSLESKEHFSIQSKYSQDELALFPIIHLLKGNNWSHFRQQKGKLLRIKVCVAFC